LKVFVQRSDYDRLEELLDMDHTRIRHEAVQCLLRARRMNDASDKEWLNRLAELLIEAADALSARSSREQARARFIR
jgi:hypothetical protein